MCFYKYNKNKKSHRRHVYFDSLFKNTSSIQFTPILFSDRFIIVWTGKRNCHPESGCMKGWIVSGSFWWTHEIPLKKLWNSQFCFSRLVAHMPLLRSLIPNPNIISINMLWLCHSLIFICIYFSSQQLPKRDPGTSPGWQNPFCYFNWNLMIGWFKILTFQFHPSPKNIPHRLWDGRKTKR